MDTLPPPPTVTITSADCEQLMVMYSVFAIPFTAIPLTVPYSYRMSPSRSHDTLVGGIFPQYVPGTGTPDGFPACCWLCQINNPSQVGPPLNHGVSFHVPTPGYFLRNLSLAICSVSPFAIPTYTPDAVVLSQPILWLSLQ